MHAFRNGVVLAALMLVGVTVTLNAQGLASYNAWKASALAGEPDVRHFYVSGTLLGLLGGSANVEIGIGGQMAQYDVTAQAVDIVGGVVVPVGGIMSWSGPHNVPYNPLGVYSQVAGTVPLPPAATALQIVLTPVGFPGVDGSTMTLLIPTTNPVLGVTSDAGAVVASITCPEGCVKVTGTCSGACGTVGPKCCKGKRHLLNCVNCTITCQDGDC